MVARRNPINSMGNVPNRRFSLLAIMLLVLMAMLAGGAALRESVTIDEISHIASGVTYLQKLDLRFNEEHPPLAKILAAVPLVFRGVHADYSHVAWTGSDQFLFAYLGQWVFGEFLLNQWNDPAPTLFYARLPMLVLTLILGWTVFAFACRLGGHWAGLLCLTVYVSSTTFLVFGPLVHTDIAVTLFSVLTLWRLADIWRDPTRKNILLFALCFAAALLSKFTAGILLFAFLATVLSLRWRSVSGQPSGRSEFQSWRRLRVRATFRGILYASILVYLFYFIFTLHESTGALSLLGSGRLTEPFRRLLLPAWIYVRGVLLVLLSSSRPTFILGKSYPHGVWFYFPVLFLLKSSFGFLGLLILTFLLFLSRRLQRDIASNESVVPEAFGMHWRVVCVSMLVFTFFCVISRLNISIRHFSIPTALLILLLSPLPRQIRAIRLRSPHAAQLITGFAVLLAVSSLFTALGAYPYFMPYLNPLSFGRPAYTLVNDSNLDWNQSLPEVSKFVARQHLERIRIDPYSMSDPALVVPQALIWDCQRPAEADAGQWVVVSAGVILDGHNCAWLMNYPNEPLVAGGMYAVHLPAIIPPAGDAKGPPLPSAYRYIGGAPIDMRGMLLDLTHHPEHMPAVIKDMQAQFDAYRKGGKPSSAKQP